MSLASQIVVMHQAACSRKAPRRGARSTRASSRPISDERNCSAVRGLRRAMAARLIVDGVDLAVQAGEIVTHDRPERRRKVHRAQSHLQYRAAARGRRSCWTAARRHRLPSARAAAAGAWPICRSSTRIFPKLTMAENLPMGGYLLRDCKLARRTHAAGIEAMFPILAERRAQYRGQLSGGEQRMLEIARTLMMDRRSSCWTSRRSALPRASSTRSSPSRAVCGDGKGDPDGGAERPQGAARVGPRHACWSSAESASRIARMR